MEQDIRHKDNIFQINQLCKSHQEDLKHHKHTGLIGVTLETSETPIDVTSETVLTEQAVESA